MVAVLRMCALHPQPFPVYYRSKQGWLWFCACVHYIHSCFLHITGRVSEDGCGFAHVCITSTAVSCILQE